MTELDLCNCGQSKDLILVLTSVQMSLRSTARPDNYNLIIQFHDTISLEFSAGHSKKCTNTVSIQIAAKNLLACQGLPVESEERCVCVWQLNVDGCIWIGRGGRVGRRERA